jgi:hypothetical protein
MSMNKELQKTEAGQSLIKPSATNTITKVISATVLAVITVFIALIIGLPIYFW